MKTHYELLGLEITADAEAIKKAFRREIARYHPDKVIHLGTEFQEMAATRAAELTVAYKTLTDEALRAQYDASLTSGVPPPHVPQVEPDASEEPPPPPRAERRPESSPREVHDAPPTIDEIKTPPPVGGGKGRFAAERADRDVILKRAIGARVMAAVEGLYGKLATPTVRGFDLAMVPLAKPRFMGTMPPRVLMKVVDTANTASVTEAYAGALKANLHAGKSPVVVLLFARNIAPQNELTKANETNARRKGDGPDEVAVIVVNVADWSCRLPPGCSPAVRKLADQICA